VTTAFAPATAVTMGEPAGVGLEITLKAWMLRDEASLAPFLLIADIEEVREAARKLDIGISVAQVEEPTEAGSAFGQSLPVLHQELSEPASLGSPTPAHAPAILGAIEKAVAFANNGTVAAVVTNPIQKESLAEAGFRYSGHTDYLGHLAGGLPTVMMLATKGLKVIPATVHVGLRQAIESLSADLLIACGRIAAQALQDDFSISSPRLVMTGLNPHAGEGGLFGFEEKLIIAPAVEQLQAEGIDVRGPVAADSLFHAAAREAYDAAICMYHDQALIPIKTLDFARAVNVTLGLPFVRTSPDHGTALDIAGRNCADPSSLIEAIRLAQSLSTNRRQQA
jgi:4-hydroxythreonine-4-phosphate dehydrogenase